MREIVGVRFKSVGKIYYFDPVDLTLSRGQYVVVETARGIECGEVVTANCSIEDDEWSQPLKQVLRLATKDDVAAMKKNAGTEERARKICIDRIAYHHLDMKLIDVECTFDGNKLLFYFSADGRVDFRELVKDLATTLKMRIELRQIGVRDEAKLLGGLGICGRPFCCSTFLGEFQPVSIRMAKEQGLSLNPAKISGTCGRLMCCLKYEQNVYDELIRITPKQGAHVHTPDGHGVVSEVNLLSGYLKVLLDKDEVATVFHRDEVHVIHRSKPETDGKGQKGQRASRNNSSGKQKNKA